MSTATPHSYDKGCLIIAFALSGVIIYVVRGCLCAMYQLDELGLGDKLYTEQEMIANYARYEVAINDFFSEMEEFTDSNQVSLEFTGSGQIDRLHYEIDGRYESNWNLYDDPEKRDSVLNDLGWSEETLQRIHEGLAIANAISYANFKPYTELGFRRAGMGMYSYGIFPGVLSDSLQKVYNDSCTYHFYRDNVVFIYAGGAIGPQCFGDYFYRGSAGR